MKKISNYLYASLIALMALSGCDENFLDINATDRVSDASIVSDSTLFEGFVINRYMSVRLTEKEAEGTPPGFGRGFEYALWSSLTDESIYNNDDNTWVIQRGQLAPENLGIAGTIWGRSYRSIRECNYALQNISSVVMSQARKDLLTAELKFIRAYRYHDLIRNYGEVVLLGDKVNNLGEDFLDPVLFQKTPVAGAIDYVAGELDDAVAGLPLNNSSSWPLGRATKGAAMALKARLLLYAASPLYGAGTWADAAQAAKDVMDLGKYDLHDDYQSLFLDENSPEIIFERLYRVGTRHVCLEISNGPNGYGGWGGNTPLQNLVDAYEVVVDENTSVPFDWNNAAHVNNMYENRDPRLYATILHNGAEYRGRQVETFIPGGADSRDGNDNWNTSKTGYYLRKFIDEDLPIQNPWDVAGTQPWIYIRFGEVLLNYAEAQNEAVGPDETVYDAINLVRERAGMPDLPINLTQEQMREAIRRERQVELAFEEHRFYDVRRWMIAMQTENVPAYGIQIEKSGDVFTYTRKVAIDGRSFKEQHHWLPIPRSEIQSSDNQLDQNPKY